MVNERSHTSLNISNVLLYAHYPLVFVPHLIHRSQGARDDNKARLETRAREDNKARLEIREKDDEKDQLGKDRHAL